MTYSIVARDPRSGSLAIGVQTYWFSVGGIVPWVEPNVGAVATQSFVEVSYGPLGLDLMRGGKTATQTLEALIQADDGRDSRQVAMIDAAGNVAAHTGSGCVHAAGHEVGINVSCQANMMERDTVWGAMLRAWHSSGGDIADRVLAALVAAEREGGDIRGRQSAALVVAPGRDAKRWDRTMDLRVEDHEDPVGELGRLLHLHRAWDAVAWAGDHAEKGEHEQARRLYEKACSLQPDDPQIALWAATYFAVAGEMDRANSLMKIAMTAEPRSAEFLKRVAAAGLVPSHKVGPLLD